MEKSGIAKWCDVFHSYLTDRWLKDFVTFRFQYCAEDQVGQWVNLLLDHRNGYTSVHVISVVNNYRPDGVNMFEERVAWQCWRETEIFTAARSHLLPWPTCMRRCAYVQGLNCGPGKTSLVVHCSSSGFIAVVCVKENRNHRYKTEK